MSFFAAPRTQDKPPIDAPAVMIATSSGQVRYADPAILARPDLVSADGALVDDQLLNTLRWVDQGFVGEGSRFLSAASAGPDSQAVHVLSTPLRRHYAVSIGHLDREACIAGLRRGLLDAAAVDRAKADRGFPSWVELGELVQRLDPAPAAGGLWRALRDQMAEALKQSPSIVLDGDAFWHGWLLAELLLTESVRHRRFGPPRLRFEAHAHSLFLTISDDRPDDAFGHAAGAHRVPARACRGSRMPAPGVSDDGRSRRRARRLAEQRPHRERRALHDPVSAALRPEHRPARHALGHGPFGDRVRRISRACETPRAEDARNAFRTPS